MKFIQSANYLVQIIIAEVDSIVLHKGQRVMQQMHEKKNEKNDVSQLNSKIFPKRLAAQLSHRGIGQPLLEAHRIAFRFLHGFRQPAVGRRWPPVSHPPDPPDQLIPTANCAWSVNDPLLLMVPEHRLYQKRSLNACKGMQKTGKLGNNDSSLWGNENARWWRSSSRLIKPARPTRLHPSTGQVYGISLGLPKFGWVFPG